MRPPKKKVGPRGLPPSGRAPMKGWEQLSARFALVPLRGLGGGFTLFRLAPRGRGGAA